jgi:hypothetical protein
VFGSQRSVPQLAGEVRRMTAYVAIDSHHHSYTHDVAANVVHRAAVPDAEVTDEERLN